MKTKIEATERPWHSVTLSRLPGEYAECMVMSENGLCIASVEATTNELAEANAALIVQAVNSHDELVRALENILTAVEIVDGSETPDQNDTEHLLACCDKARAALQRVKGGE